MRRPQVTPRTRVKLTHESATDDRAASLRRPVLVPPFHWRDGDAERIHWAAVPPPYQLMLFSSSNALTSSIWIAKFSPVVSFWPQLLTPTTRPPRNIGPPEFP